MNTASRVSRKAARFHAAGSAVSALLAALLVTAPAQAIKPGQFRLISTSIETSSTLVSLPAAGGDLVRARACESCDGVELRLAATTEFRINGRKVDLARFRSAAGSGTHTLHVYYRRDDRTLTRLSLETGE